MDPTAVDWQPRYESPEYEFDATSLFDQVRAQFCEGISNLENLHHCMQLRSSADCKVPIRGIDNLYVQAMLMDIEHTY